MRILHLAWEYPPVLFGGLGRHVHALATAQAAQGHDVVVITQAPNSAAPARIAGGSDRDDGVRVIRVTVDPSAQLNGDLIGHIASLEDSLTSAGHELLGHWQPDVIHAHDWMVAHAAVRLRRSSGVPLTATIHATEAGRNRGWISNDLSAWIHGVEGWLANTCDALITCSWAMRAEVGLLFGAFGTHVVPNGIEPADWCPPEETSQLVRDAVDQAEPVIVCTGRVEWEKGVQTLLSAMPALRADYPRIRAVIAGQGSYLADLRHQADDLDLGESVCFLGWVDEADLRSVMGAGDLAVAPSLYEPFGLVALEAAAIGTPLVVSRSGGLAEFADNDRAALTFTPGDAESLAGKVRNALEDPEATRGRAYLATRAIWSDHSWQDVARRTVEVYRQASGRLGAGPGDPVHEAAEQRHSLDEARGDVPRGRLLDVGR